MGTDDDIVYDNRVAQTFLATSTGFLEDISFVVHRLIATGIPADLRVSVTSVLGGQPGDLLESVLIPYELISTQSPVSVPSPTGTFTTTVSTSGSVLLVAGETYALVFSTDTTEANYRLRGDEYLYPEGSLLRYQNFGSFQGGTNSDLLFRITATPIPEPQAMSVFSVMLGLCVLRRRRKANERNCLSDRRKLSAA